MTLLVQEYLVNHTFAELAKNFGVYASFSKCGSFWSMNYDQIDAKESDLLSQQCRGLILSCKNGQSLLSQAIKVNEKFSYTHVCPGETIVFARGMDRFFNYGQGVSANINWSDSKLSVLEKLDGSLCLTWYNPFTKQWNIATRGCPEADLLMDNGLFTFRTLFEKAVQDTLNMDFETFTSYLNQYYTYCFELTTPYNRIVVNYPNNRITLLAVRDTFLDMIEYDPAQTSIVKDHGFPCAQAHTYTTLEEIVNWVSSLNPMEHEGVVIRDSKFNRIKVKNAAYVAASKIRDSLATSPRNCLELILLGKDDDAASFLPQEIQNSLISLKEKFVLWLKDQEDLIQVISNEAKSIAPDKKTFALTVQKYQPALPSALFAIYDGKANSIKSFIEANRKDGTWSNSFIDKILSVI